MGHGSTAGASRDGGRGLDLYDGLRVAALGCPLHEDEESVARDTARLLERWLRLDPGDAVRQARRRMVLRRDAALHELLLRRMSPRRLDDILDAIEVEGMPDDASGRGDGAVLLSLHYSLYSSLLVLWLARAVTRGLFPHLAILYWATEDGTPSALADAMRRCDEAGLVRASALRLVDLGGGPVRATRTVISAVQEGGAALVFADRIGPPGVDARSVTVTIGERPLGIARGVPWLVHAAGCAVIPVHIRPCGNRHRIVFGRPLQPGDGGGAADVVRAALQHLLDETVRVDPGPWDGWPALVDVPDPGIPVYPQGERPWSISPARGPSTRTSAR